MPVTDEVRKQMTDIIKNKKIKSVFQPIVSLRNGQVYGYEALSRITLENCSFHIGEAFEIAQEMNCLWAFEKLCRVQSIKASSKKPKGANQDIHRPIFRPFPSYAPKNHLFFPRQSFRMYMRSCMIRI